MITTYSVARSHPKIVDIYVVSHPQNRQLLKIIYCDNISQLQRRIISRMRISPTLKFSFPFLVTSVSALAFSSSSSSATKVAVFGGTGYVGSAVCERLINRGYDVTAVSRRGVNPKPGNDALEQVNWVSGDATDPSVVKKIVEKVRFNCQKLFLFVM